MQESHMALEPRAIERAVLAWYDREARALPWRAPPKERQDPYKVWLSEIMLQQTTVKAVAPRYIDFLRRWPDVAALARAELGEVLAAWAGLGYYARARNLHACARAVAGEHGGDFPDTEAELRKLPGIGAYTAAAIAAIAFGKRATAVDGNIERVMARLFAVERPLPAAKKELKALAESLTPETRAGDFAQSLMDLGATICTPRRPACGLCPVRPACRGYAQGVEDGAVLLRTRPLKGLLGGMLEVPSTPWEETAPTKTARAAHAPVDLPWQDVSGRVEHTFTHFHLELCVVRAVVPEGVALLEVAEPERCRWLTMRELPGAALPTVMRKVLAHAFEAKAKRRAPKKQASKTRASKTRASPVRRSEDRRSA
jgi:A/G-specific adenine glycosylase